MLSLSLDPIEHLSDRQRAAGLRWTTWQGITATAIYSVINNGFLVAFALALGANNLQVGILAALPFIGQPFQIAAMYLVERFRRRKLITMICWAPAQTVWLLLAFIPLLIEVPSGLAVSGVIALMAVRSILIAFVNTSSNSWLRDLVPQSTLGSYFSRRLAVATMAAVGFGLAAAFFVDVWNRRVPAEDHVYAYSIVLTVGAIMLGFTSVIAMGMVPEPRMTPADEQVRLGESLRAPFQDPSFTHLVRFLAAWSFASSLAIPFFTVHMLVRLSFPLPLVIGLMTLSQAVMAVFLGLWGPLADRFGFKVVLSLCASLYLFVILAWTFTAVPDPHAFTVPMAVVLLAFAGIAAAGVNLSVETIGLKLAPEGRSTPHLVAASLATSLGAALAPIMGGGLVDFFTLREMSVIVGWRGPEGVFDFPAFFLTGFDFLFALAFLFGLPTLLLLRGVRERGEVSHDIVLDELYAQGLGLSRAGSLVPGLSLSASVPFAYLRRVPGINVGVGATLYELRAAARGAVAGLHGGRRLASTLADRLQGALADTLTGQPMDERGAEIAREVAMGVIDSSEQMGMPPEIAAEHALRGAATVVAAAGASGQDAVKGAAEGAVLSVAKAGSDIDLAASGIMQAARVAGESLGLSEASAMQGAARGVALAIEALQEGKVRPRDDAGSPRGTHAPPPGDR